MIHLLAIITRLAPPAPIGMLTQSGLQMLTQSGSIMEAQSDPWTLKAEAASHGALLGASMQTWDIFTMTAGLQDLVEEQFAALMPSNAFKWVNSQPAQGIFDLDEADAFVAWVDARGMTMPRLHPLVWHESLPSWVVTALAPGTWQSIIDAHIDGVLSHYPGRTWEVDVVNEVFLTEDGESGGFRDTLFYQAAAGPDYIPYAFERARVHAPSAQLFIADFDLEQAGQDTKRANLLAAVTDWLSQSVPIDGVALQGHLDVAVALDATALTQFITDIIGLGLKVTIGEFDLRNIASLGLSDNDAFAFAGAYTHDFLTTALDAGADALITWGVSEDDWSRTAFEQIATVPFGPSPAFVPTSIAFGVRSALRQSGV